MNLVRGSKLASNVISDLEVADKRTSAWLKLKKDYVEGVSDSLDLVPIGAWHGNGRKVSTQKHQPSSTANS